MSHISKPVDWEVYSVPPIQPVQYYSILKKQREFSQLIKQYDAQVFRHGYLHYCGIVPKYLSSSLSNRYEIFIVLLNETPTTSFIGFRVIVSKETFTYESKSLLLFLKKSEKAVFYNMNNNCIHVHCGTNAWELFYLLYDDFLRRYVLTIIGTRFFYHFVYSYYIEKEKQLLKLLYKGSKVIRVSKSSIYYKIHRKRKISVSNLIHMTLNMPKRKKYTLPYFNSKESLLYSDVGYNDFYTVAGNKISVSKLMLKKYMKEAILSEKHSQKLIVTDGTHKRMFDEIDTNQSLGSDTSSKYFKTSESCCTENQWKQYQKFESYTVKSYSTISFKNTHVPSHLKTGKSFYNSNLPSIKHSNVHFPMLLSSDKKKDTSENSENIKDIPLLESKSFDQLACSECVIHEDFSSHYSTLPNNDHQCISCTRDSSVVTKRDINTTLTNIKDINNDDATEDVNFATAAGKVINVSSAAMLKAYKFCNNEELMTKKSTSNVVKHEVPEKIDYLYSKKKIVTKDISLPKIYENNYSQEFSFFKNNENMPKFSTSQSSSNKNLQLDYHNASEDVTFSTAVGKTINISNSAMEAAQKLMYKSTDEEKMSLHCENLPVQRNLLYKCEINSNACTSKTDVDLDNTLVEKIFEDVQFDEKELELTDNVNVIFESKNDKNLPARKLRKSLGGRRSMRYCSDKL